MSIVILIVMLVMFGLITFYIAKRITDGIKAVCPKFPFAVISIPLFLLTACTLLGFIRLDFIPLDVMAVLEVISAYWMGIFMYLLLFVLAIDIITLILKIFKLKFTKKTFFKVGSAALAVVLTVITVLYGIGNAKKVNHVSYTARINKGLDVSDINLVMLSDLHLGSVGSEERLEDIVEQINSLNPDVVCIVGDTFDTDFGAIKNPQKAMETLKSIKSTYGVYACLGNHDAGATTVQKQDFLKKSNILLLNEKAEIIDSRLVLIGRLDSSPIGGMYDQSRAEFESIYKGLNNALPVVVLDHNPKNISEYNQEVDLILCGHTHQGQLFPLNFITDSIYEVDYGIYKKNLNVPTVIVSSGVGYWGPPMRVGTNSEIVSIKLESANV